MMAPFIGLDPDEIAEYFDSQSPDLDY
jgi:hypothetical protein